MSFIKAFFFFQFYDSLPRCELDLSAFERLALERLRLLRAVEKVSSLGAAKYSKEWTDKMDEETRKAQDLNR